MARSFRSHELATHVDVSNADGQNRVSTLSMGSLETSTSLHVSPVHLMYTPIHRSPSPSLLFSEGSIFLRTKNSSQLSYPRHYRPLALSIHPPHIGQRRTRHSDLHLHHLHSIPTPLNCHTLVPPENGQIGRKHSPLGRSLLAAHHRDQPMFRVGSQANHWPGWTAEPPGAGLGQLGVID